VRVLTFAPALVATEDEGGGVNVDGFPLTHCFVSEFPSQITISMVVVVCALAGDEHRSEQYIVTKSPDGERAGAMVFRWQWDDNPEAPVKFRVFLQQLPLQLTTAGVYTIGLYDSLEATETETEFPLPVHQYDPLTQGPGHF
jgi:hypothetical protein